jgi:ankyrin repeat protein
LLKRFGADALFRKNKNGENLLYVAAIVGSSKFVRRFLESGLDPREKN